MNIYRGLVSNYVTDVQIAEYVEWIVREKKEGIFHVGTTDVIDHGDCSLIADIYDRGSVNA